MSRYLLQLCPDYGTGAYDELDAQLSFLSLRPSACYARPGGHAPRLCLEAAARAAGQAQGAPLPLSRVLDLRRVNPVAEAPFLVITLPTQFFFFFQLEL